MQHLLTKIEGWVQNGPQGNNKQGWFVPALISAAATLYGAEKQRQANVQASNEAKELAKEQFNKQRTMLGKVKREGERMGPMEAKAFQTMEKGAREGTMDVEALTQQSTAPIYQAGAEAKQQAQGKVITQGLEGSIIAQEVARKIDTKTMQTISKQARSIALANEATKAQAGQALTTAQLSRSEKLKQIAMNYELGLGKAEMAKEAGITQANIQNIQGQGQYAASLASGLGQAASTAYSGYQSDLASTQAQDQINEINANLPAGHQPWVILGDGSIYNPNE